jgi:aminopeptidase N
LKRILFFSFAFCFLLVKAQQAPTNEQFLKLVESEKQAHVSITTPTPLTTISDYDVIYHRCEWQVDPAVRSITGKVTTYFKPLTTNFDSIKFNLTDSLTVDSVKYHNSPLLISHSGNIINALLPSVIPMNTLDSVSIYYHGVPANSGFGSFVQSTHSATNNTPVIWTLSEPNGASDWWPCKNSLTDKADSIDVIITSPSAYRAASNGLLVSETIIGSNRICHWRHRYPIATYLICLAVTNYVQYTSYVPFNLTNLLELSYVYPEDSANVVTQTPADIPIMQLYDSLFGIYPFMKEKYGHVEAGMTEEHQTMTFFGITSFGFETLAHELAHHWFGDKITCASWHDVWLNEGFATYLSGLCYEHMQNGYWWMPFKVMRMNWATSVPNGSVWCPDTLDYNRIFDSNLSYGKGAMILHQLRWILGDATFFAAINNYLNDPLLAYGFAHTYDLQHHFEIASGQNLTWYFNDWFTGKGFPSYQINWNQVTDTVHLTVNQTQSDPSVTFFALPLPIEFKNATKDTIIRLQNNFSGQNFSVHIPFNVDSVKLDPQLWIITANNLVSSVNENEILKYVSVFPNPVHDHLQIIFSKPFDNMTMKLLDVTGREIKNIFANNKSNVTIDCKETASGFYLLQFNSAGQTASKKIIIH